LKNKNKVAFDAAFLMIAIRKDKIRASVDKAKERVDHLISSLSQRGEQIIVPTPALAEMLVHAGPAVGTYLDELQKSSRFRIASFDTKAAVEVAADIAASVTKGAKKAGAAGTWAKANFDRQIVAIAKASDAHTVYTDDGDVDKHAKRMGLEVVRLADLDLPPSKTPLLDILDELPASGEQQDEQPTAQRKESNELKTDTAHPAPIQGSGGGRTEGETTRETAEEEKEQP
jgi:rRNA maturation endonuclease Nob1